MTAKKKIRRIWTFEQEKMQVENDVDLAQKAPLSGQIVVYTDKELCKCLYNKALPRRKHFFRLSEFISF